MPRCRWYSAFSGRQRQRAFDGVERLVHPAALHLGRRQQPVPGGVPIVAGERRRDDLRGLVKLPAAQQQLGRMMRVGAIGRRQRTGAQRQVERRLAVIEGEHRARQVSQHSGVFGLDLRGARQIPDRVVVPAGARQQTAGMNRVLGCIRLDRDCRGGVLNGAVDLARDGERTAGMAVPGGPTRAAFQKAFIGRRRLFVARAIAEQPGAEIDDRLAPWSKPKSGAGALDRLVVLPAVIKCFSQPTIKTGALGVGQAAIAQIGARRFELAAGDRPLDARGVSR